MRLESMTACQCSILDAREERLLDDEGHVELRLICNRCGAVLDTQTVRRARPAAGPTGPDRGGQDREMGPEEAEAGA